MKENEYLTKFISLFCLTFEFELYMSMILDIKKDLRPYSKATGTGTNSGNE